MKQSSPLWRIASPGLAVLLTIILIVPSLYEANQMRSDRFEIKTLKDEVSRSLTRRTRLTSAEQGLNAELAELEARAMLSGAEEKFRQQFLELVRKNNGQLRQLEIGAAEKRHWYGREDHPDQNSNSMFADEPSGFLLHMHPVELQVDGHYEDIRQLIKGILEKNWLADLTTFGLVPMQDGSVRLQIGMRMYGLSPDDGSLDDDFASLRPTSERR